MRFLSQSRPAGGRHRHQGGHRRGRHHSLHPGCDQPSCGRSEAAPAPLSAADLATAETLYVCVGKHCPEGRAVFDALRQESGDSGIAVEPCGCLDLCEQGPVAIALPGGVRPPRKGETGAAPLATFFTVTPADAPRIIAALPGRQKQGNTP
jgi:(2Fe-2S) ferredoxin